MIIAISKFIVFSLILVGISKYILVPLLRKLGEVLELKPKTIGNISGFATSVPELLTVSFSAFSGLIGTSTYNILSSNIINLVQYMFSIHMNKNRKGLQNKAVKIDLGLVFFTIIIPIGMLLINMEANISTVPIFLLLFVFFNFLNNNAHKLYLEKEEKEIGEQIEKETKRIKGKDVKTLLYATALILTGIALFVVGNALGAVLEDLSIQFNIPEFVLGILLGAITSIPELITFFEAQKHHSKENREDLGIIEATNNLLSSNLLNLFVIQSIGIVIFEIISK